MHQQCTWPFNNLCGRPSALKLPEFFWEWYLAVFGEHLLGCYSMHSEQLPTTPPLTLVAFQSSCSKWSQMDSMMFKSGLCGSHSISYKTLCSSLHLKYLFTLFVVCLVSLSCWNRKLGPINHLPEGTAWWIKICLSFHWSYFFFLQQLCYKDHSSYCRWVHLCARSLSNFCS